MNTNQLNRLKALFVERKTLFVVLGAVLIVLGAVLSFVAFEPTQNSGSIKSILPLETFSAPAGLKGGTSEDTNGYIYVLVNKGTAANVQSINGSNGHVIGIFPVSNAATSIALSSTNIIAIGTAFGATGSVEFHTQNGTKIALTPLSGPVSQVVAEADGISFIALTRSEGNYSAVVINSKTGKVVTTVPLSSASVSIAVSPDGTTIYDLLSSGVVQLANIQTLKILQSFPVAAGGIGITLSADGSSLYELKGAVNARNVSVVSIATESIQGVLPAPANCIALAPSLNQLGIFDFVGTPTFSNIQFFSAAI